MTELEAKEKWCPMVFGRNSLQFNRDACFDEGGTHCIGSACMMWRWDRGPVTVTPAADPEMVNIEYDRPGNGYCGLASKP